MLARTETFVVGHGHRFHLNQTIEVMRLGGGYDLYRVTHISGWHIRARPLYWHERLYRWLEEKVWRGGY